MDERPGSVQVWPTVDYYCGRLMELARSMRDTMWMAEEFGLPIGDLREAHSLVAGVVRKARAKATGLSEEELAQKFMDNLKEAMPERRPTTEDDEPSTTEDGGRHE